MEKNEREPGYMAFIPPEVRYHKKLSPNAKLMYGEVAVLANLKGYCFASNEYIAKLYHVSHRSVRAWIQQLEDEGFIEVEILHGTERRIYISPGRNVPAPRNISSGTPEENFRHNEYINDGKNISVISPPEDTQPVVEKWNDEHWQYRSAVWALEKLESIYGDKLAVTVRKQVSTEAGRAKVIQKWTDAIDKTYRLDFESVGLGRKEFGAFLDWLHSPTCWWIENLNFHSWATVRNSRGGQMKIHKLITSWQKDNAFRDRRSGQFKTKG